MIYTAPNMTVILKAKTLKRQQKKPKKNDLNVEIKRQIKKNTC
jgi:hypothetical protein